MYARSRGGLWDTVRTIIYAILIALVARTVAYEPFNIPSSSMVPTLLVGDYLFVSKYSYGYSRYSLPFGLPLIADRIFYTIPERGDVAVFKLPSDNRTDYIKRIIGLPGDEIQMKEGRLYINGEIVQRESIEDFTMQNSHRSPRSIQQYIETLPNGRRHRIIEASDEGQLDNTPVYKVPPHHYFAMGDNRDNSLDSRAKHGVGFIPKDNLVGRAEVLFFSVNGGTRIWEVWKWPVAIRFRRFFQAVQ
ncbi:MAG: signal peptidase I [Alphaproteobacteria bacterium]|nr:signal peptidase I [Alphaproteobacteria bacterium]